MTDLTLTTEFVRLKPVQWGGVTLPDVVSGILEQTYNARIFRNIALQHLPTQLVMWENSMNLDRGHGTREFVFFVLGETDRALRLFVSQADHGVFVGVRNYSRAQGIDHSSLPVAEQFAAESEFLHRFGLRFRCIEARPEPRFEPLVFTPELRDAAMRLLCWILPGSYVDRTGPFPIEVDFQPEGLPEDLDATLTNPYAEVPQ